MSTAVIYARMPVELKNRLIVFANTNSLQQNEALNRLINLGLDNPEVKKDLQKSQEKTIELEEKINVLKSQITKLEANLALAQYKVDDAQRAKAHLQRTLSIQVGKCGVTGCDAPITLWNFAFQQCPNGHVKSMELNDVYKKAPSAGEAIVTGLAIMGAVVLATELLGGKGS
jgi:hypothetical protein